MTDDVFRLLARHYASIAKELGSQAEQANLLNHATAVGTEREEVYLDFIKRYLPATCDAFLGGYLFDLQGNSSTQMDIIVTSGHTPRFKMSRGNKYIAPLEGTIAVAEVKSQLTKEKLHAALAGCSSIPAMPNQAGIVATYLKIPELRWQDTPYKIVFAYDGLEARTVCEHLDEYYRLNSEIPLSRRPNILHVLNKYMIVRFAPDMSVRNLDGSEDANQPAVGEYKLFELAPDVSSALWTLQELHHLAFMSSHLMYKFDGWHTNIMRLIQQDM